MAGTVSGATSRDLECPVCRQDLSQPKMLPCSHLACRGCVLSMLHAACGTEDPPSPLPACPTCKVPIVGGAGGGAGGGVVALAEEDLQALVDGLPTDLATMTLLDSHKVLSSQHVCKVCENSVAATSFCLHCHVKLCRTCAKGHAKLPALQHHLLEDLTHLTAQRLAASILSRCKTHDDRPAEVFCSAHSELICMLCATTNHRGCSEVKVIPDMAKEKRLALKQDVAALREREKVLSVQVKEVKDMFKVLRKRVKDTWDDLLQNVKRRRVELSGAIQAEEDCAMATVSQWEKTRAAIRTNASSLESLADTAPDVALLGMLSKLTSRLRELDQRSRTSEKAGPIVDVAFETQKLNHLKSVVSGLGVRAPCFNT
ncbi:putative E3 ubiquitin-protein ligase MID2 [Babylonia areolata]|uniref:putative E3 ubiquitin-protein ligase MID2 n=1 Tax=Babylonia areolata TaxID=304850 RepID=UPI003FD17CF4